MSREPARILTFKRLARLGGTRQLALFERVDKKFEEINRQIKKKKLGKFARPYVYVALATCLEADLKYKARVIMELAGSDVDIFRKLYGEGKIDLDLLFHVVDERITLSDLVSETMSVSDCGALIHRSEAILNIVSGNKLPLKQYFQRAAEALDAGKPPQPFSAVSYLEKYDLMIRHIDSVFQIRHAIVHDVTAEGGPIKWASRQYQLEQVAMSCGVYNFFFNRAFLQCATQGPIAPQVTSKRNSARFDDLMNEGTRLLNSIQRKYKGSQPEITKLVNSFTQLMDILFDIIEHINPKLKGDDAMLSDHTLNTYAQSWANICRAIQLETSFPLPTRRRPKSSA